MNWEGLRRLLHRWLLIRMFPKYWMKGETEMKWKINCHTQYAAISRIPFQTAFLIIVSSLLRKMPGNSHWTQPNAIYNVDHQFLLIFQGFNQDILSYVFEAENINHLSQKNFVMKRYPEYNHLFHLFQNFLRMGLSSHSVLLNSVAAELQSWSWQAKVTRHTFLAPHSLTCFLYFKYNILIFQSFSTSGAGHELVQRKGDCQVSC